MKLHQFHQSKLNRDILAPMNEGVLEDFVTRRTLFAFDFDGTLASFDDDPDQVAMKPSVFEKLERLASLAHVTIITGRTVDDVRKRIPQNIAVIVGNHGAESPFLPDHLAARALQNADEWAEKIPTIIAHLDFHSVRLEHKGVSLTLHLSEPAEIARIPDLVSELKNALHSGPRFIPGRRSLSLVWNQLPDKGQALIHLLSQCGAARAIYVGDDITDEDVFRRADERILTIKIRHAEDTSALFAIPTQPDISTLLSRFNRMLRDAAS